MATKPLDREGLILSKACLSQESVDAHLLRARKIFHLSCFGFLMAHLGIRPGCLHGFMGTMGSGKSTVLKKIITESAEGARCLVYLTEEKVEEFQAGINAINSYAPVLANIRFIEQRSIREEGRSIQYYREGIERCVERTRPNILFIDNIATSLFYGDHIPAWEQMKTIQWLVDMAKRLDVAIFYVAHTRKDVTDNMPRLFTPEDIRGSTMLPIQTEYFYTMQKFKGNTKQYNVVQNCKHRHHDKASGFFLLHYDNGKYLKDTKILFDDVDKIFKERDQLGRRKKRNDDDF